MVIKTIVLFVVVSLYGAQLSLAKKPSDLTQGIFCEGCVATVTELQNKVSKKTGESREVRVVDAMDDICNLQNFGKYDYSPPKTGQACRYLIENFDEDIERLFVSETEGLEQKICYQLTKACEGVDRSKKDKEEMEFRINDEKQKLETGTPAKKNEPETMHIDINDKDAAEKLVQSINESVKKHKAKDEDDEKDDEDEKDEDEKEEDEKEEDEKEDEKDDDEKDDDEKDDEDEKDEL